MPRGVYERRQDKYPRLKSKSAATPCIAPGCDRIANRPRLKLCETHYYRQRRHGSFDLPGTHWRVRGRKGRYSTSDGYVIVDAPPGHPLANSQGLILEHRLIYHQHHGDGPFDCHWCGKVVTWKTLHIDHVNETKNDNAPSNLVASCNICNPKRGFHKSKASNQARGLNLTFDGQTLPVSVWAERLGLSKVSLKARLASGWPLERALTEPRGKFGPRGLA